MLPAYARLRRRTDFLGTLRRGPHVRRFSGRLLVTSLHAAPGSPPDPRAPVASARIGIVVSKAVGTAVVRNRVRRRLRALAAQRRPSLPSGSNLVIQAKPAAATASSAELADDVDAALRGVLPRTRP